MEELNSIVQLEYNTMLKNLQEYTNDLLNWIEKNGYAGWDPYDVQGSEFYTNYLQKGNSFFIKLVGF